MVFWIGVFILLMLWNRNRFRNVFLLAILLFSVVMSILNKTFFAPYYDFDTRNLMMSVFLFAVFPAVLLILSIASFFSSKVLMEKEGRKVRNLFISLIGLGALGIFVMTIYQFNFSASNDKLLIIYTYVTTLYFYFLGLFLATALYSLIYMWLPIRYTPDYIIVLGSGLIGDKVPPLLASRLDKAVQQYEKYGRKPLFITSGGQGHDEKLAEAVAMKKYIIAKYNIPEENILVEDQSTTTFENLTFSKKIIDARIKKAQGIIVTNNFHVLRAGIYSRRVGLKAVGVGSKTAFYYVPNAFMREFIGLLEMYKLYHLAIIGGITLLFAFLYWGVT